MQQPRALITGISGQDGRYLTSFLKQKGYSVCGVITKARGKPSGFPFDDYKDILFVEVDYLNPTTLLNEIAMFNPQEIYNLVGLSSVQESFNEKMKNSILNEVIPIQIGRYIAQNRQFKYKMFHASSSEMFAGISNTFINESTILSPISPYGTSKAKAHKHLEYLRNKFGLFISCGIMFNHESRFRSEKFVTRKISRQVAECVLGIRSQIELGNVKVKRDWGFAGDYVEAMWLMLQNESPDDYVVATGISQSVESLTQISLKNFGLSLNDRIQLVSLQSEKRNRDHFGNVGDASKAKDILGWKATTATAEWLQEMVDNDLRLIAD